MAMAPDFSERPHIAPTPRLSKDIFKTQGSKKWGKEPLGVPQVGDTLSDRPVFSVERLGIGHFSANTPRSVEMSTGGIKCLKN